MSQKQIKQRDPKAGRQKKKLAAEMKLTNVEVTRALREASAAIDTLKAENQSLRRIIVAERAQVIYYTEKAVAFAAGKSAELFVRGFDQLEDQRKEAYVKQALAELGSEDQIAPHQVDGEPAEGPKPKLIV